jgi:hypothetical protein
VLDYIRQNKAPNNKDQIPNKLQIPINQTVSNEWLLSGVILIVE